MKIGWTSRCSLIMALVCLVCTAGCLADVDRGIEEAPTNEAFDVDAEDPTTDPSDTESPEDEETPGEEPPSPEGLCTGQSCTKV